MNSYVPVASENCVFVGAYSQHTSAGESVRHVDIVPMDFSELSHVVANLNSGRLIVLYPLGQVVVSVTANAHGVYSMPRINDAFFITVPRYNKVWLNLYSKFVNASSCKPTVTQVLAHDLIQSVLLLKVVPSFGAIQSDNTGYVILHQQYLSV